MKSVYIGCLVSGMVFGNAGASMAALEKDNTDVVDLSSAIRIYYADKGNSTSANEVQCRIVYHPMLIHSPLDGGIIGVRLVPDLVDC